MSTLIIGHRGFVGGNLAHHYPQAMGAGRAEMPKLQGQVFSQVFCAAPQARKWWANQNPELDLQEVKQLANSCRTLSCIDRFFLFSTVDVYDQPANQDEQDTPSPEAHPYGANRLYLEKVVLEAFGDKARIIRLPALVGNGLKKNIVFDLLYSNNVENINAHSVFQWFNLVHLPEIIHKATNLANCQILNVVSEPLPTSSLVGRWFPELVDRLNWNCASVSYDLHTIHGPAGSRYLYYKDDVIRKHLGPFIESTRARV